MLVPVQGGVAALQKRNRTIHFQRAALARVQMGKVYIYNVGPWQQRGVGGGKQWVIPACPKGQRYSSPLAIPELNLSEYDLADGGGNMGTLTEPALSGVMEIDNEEKMVTGIVDDIIGKNFADIDINTTNKEWFGVFASTNLNDDGDPEPLEAELEAAEEKLRQWAQLLYAVGSEKVQKGESVRTEDRKNYNWAAQHLGLKPLWGNLDHTLTQCPECGEDIRQGAKFCKHCQQPIDPASVAARQRSRESAAEKTLADQEAGEAETPSSPQRGKTKSPKGKTARSQAEFGE